MLNMAEMVTNVEDSELQEAILRIKFDLQYCNYVGRLFMREELKRD